MQRHQPQSVSSPPLLAEPLSSISHTANGKVITSVDEATAADVDRAVVAAHKAFNTTWGLHAPGATRAALLNKLGNLMVEHYDELAAIEALDNGSSPFFHSDDIFSSVGSCQARRSVGPRLRI